MAAQNGKLRRMPTPPQLSPESRSAGFQNSLALRRTRAEFKAQLASEGRYWLLEHWGMDAVQGMRVFDLLRALPGVGPATAGSILTDCKIGLRTTVSKVGRRQRERLFALLGE